MGALLEYNTCRWQRKEKDVEGNMCGWMEFNLSLDMLDRHVDLCQAWNKHGGNITSKFANCDQDKDWEDDDNEKN
jgi:hypothetical protein